MAIGARFAWLVGAVAACTVPELPKAANFLPDAGVSTAGDGTIAGDAVDTAAGTDAAPSTDTAPPSDTAAPTDTVPPTDTAAPVDTVPETDSAAAADSAETAPPPDLAGSEVDAGDTEDAGAPPDTADGSDSTDMAVGPACKSAAECEKPCNIGDCTPAGVCKFVPKAGGCDDGDKCSTNDACKDGACAAGDVVKCDDGEPCTADSCDPKSGCKFEPTNAVCTDNSACTTADKCADGKCVGSAKVCADDKPCTDDGCDPKADCTFLPNAATCTDNDACTVGDACKAGLCAPGFAALCDDKNGCTDDSCHKTDGCKVANNTAACSDGDACTEGDGCKAATCVGGAPPVCDDKNACTDDSCDKAKGCVVLANAVTCTDGDACTTGDACKDKGCQPGTKTLCADANECTTDGCDKAKGCTVADAVDGTECDDGNACVELDACKGGVCMGKPGLWAKQYGSDQDDRFYGNVVDLQGNIYVVGVNSSDLSTAAKTHASVHKLNAAGAVVWQKVLPEDNGAAYAIAVGTDASVVFTRNHGVAPAIQTCVTRIQPADGSVVKEACLNTGTSFLAGRRGLVRQANGDFVVALRNYNGSTYLGTQLLLADKDLKSLGKLNTVPNGGKAGYNFISMAPLANSPVGGSLAIAGVTGKVGTNAYLAVVDQTGAVKWSTDDAAIAPSIAGFLSVIGVAELSDGHILAAAQGPTAVATIVEFAGDGKVLRTQPIGKVDDQIVNLLQAGDGTVIFSGKISSKGAGKEDIWLGRLDADLHLVWDTTYGGAGSDEGFQLRVTKTGFVVSGWYGQGTAHGLVLRGDAFGNLTCVGSGGCMAKANLACADKDPCTSDTCALGKCVHPPGGDGVGCEDGVACTVLEACAGGVCKGGKDALWSATVGGLNADALSRVAPTPTGGTVAVGKTASHPGGAGEYDIWLVNRDAAGTEQFNVVFGGAGADFGYDVVATAAGYVAVGHVTGDGHPVAYALQVDAAGKKVWDAKIATGNIAWLQSVVQRPDGGFAAAGYNAKTAGGASNGHLVLFQADGKVQTDPEFGTTDNEEFGGIAVVAANNTWSYWVAGETWKGSDNGGASGDGWLVRLDAAGVKNLDLNLGIANVYDRLTGVVADASGCTAIGSAPGVSGPQGLRLVRVDNAGKVVWDQRFGPAGEGQHVLRLGDGGYLLTGTKVPSAGLYTPFMVRTDALGVGMWQLAPSPTATEVWRGTAATPSGTIVVVGETKVAAAGGVDGLTFAMDAYGNTDCGKSGACLTTPLAACDDKNPCTADLCDAAHNGCWHTNLPDTLLCGTGKTCKSGLCQ